MSRPSSTNSDLAAITLEARNPGAMTGSGNHTYLVVGGQDAVLIDAGVGEAGHLDDLDRALADREAQLTDVLVTHAHGDHAAGAAAISHRHPPARFHKYPWPAEDRKYEVPWRPVRDGDCFASGARTLVGLHTPGHSPDHLVFWHEASATIFSGDLVVAGSSVMIHASHGGDLRQYLDSLERLRALRPRRLLPAHGEAIDDPDRVIGGYLAHRLHRERQVLAVLSAGRQTVESITESIYHGLDPALVPAARENVRAHLLKLEQEGRAVEEESSHTWTT